MHYLAPELLADASKPKSMKADIWALGILFFRLIRGRHFYAGETRADLTQAINTHASVM